MRKFKFAEPITINGMLLKNRFVMPGMGTLYGDYETNTVNERFKGYIEARAKGGMGLIIVEYSAVSPEGRAAAMELGIWDDRFIPGLRELTDTAHKYGAKIGIQLHHCGSATTKDVCGCQPVAPTSGIGYKDMPRELEIDEIERLVDAFGDAATRAKKAGFDCVEIHGAHGYLISQFMSPYSNKRNDKYGGNQENRMRFPLEIVKAVRKSVGDEYPILFRYSSEEHIEGGRTLQDAIEEAKMLEQAGVDVLNVSVGFLGMSGQWIITPGYQEKGFLKENACSIKKAVSIPVIVVGKIHNPEIAEAILKEGCADLVAIGRASIVDPEFPNKAIDGRWDEIKQCLHCLTGCYNEPVGCAQNPEVGHEFESNLQPATSQKKVVVVGGGPAGLEAAIVSAMRGHRVTVIEKNGILGGQINYAKVPPWKDDLKNAIDFRQRKALSLGVEIITGVDASINTVKSFNPDVVIVATGATPKMIDIRGLDPARMVSAVDILSGDRDFGKNVIIVGGGSIGCETAHFLWEQGSNVTIIELLPSIAGDIPFGEKVFLLDALKGKVDIYTNTKIVEMKEDTLFIETSEGRKNIDDINTVVIAIGMTPDCSLAGIERELGNAEIRFIGDAKKVKRIQEAVASGYEAGISI